MQPNGSPFQSDGLNTNEQQQPVVSAPQPLVQPQPTMFTNQQVSMSSSNKTLIGEYLDNLLKLVTNPKAFTTKPVESLIKSLIFPLLNLAVMVLVSVFVRIVTLLTDGSSVELSRKFNGDFWSLLFKNLAMTSLYSIAFIAIIAGVVTIFVLIAKKDHQFKDVVASISVFSLNFLAVAIAAVIGMISVWIKNIDFDSFIGLVNNLIISTIFIYTCVIIIVDIIKLTGQNLLKSTAIFVGSTILVTFILGKMITTFGSDFGISFGQYRNSISNSNASQSYLEAITEKVNDTIESMFDF